MFNNMRQSHDLSGQTGANRLNLVDSTEMCSTGSPSLIRRDVKTAGGVGVITF